jgi:hypothetical protein
LPLLLPAEVQCPDVRGGELRHTRESSSAVVALVRREVFRIPFALVGATGGSLLQHPRSRVFTTDSDFAIYQRNGRHVVPLLAPPDVAGHHGARNSPKRKTGNDAPGQRDLLAPKLRATATSSRSDKTI